MLTKDQIKDILKLSDVQSGILVDKYVEKIVAVLDMLKVADFADYSFVLTDHKTGKKTEVIKQNQHYSYSYDENVDHIKQKNHDTVSFSEEIDLSDRLNPELNSGNGNLVSDISDHESEDCVNRGNDESDLQTSNKQADANNGSDKKTDTKLIDLHKNLYS